MTQRQIKICKIIRKYENVDTVLKKCKIPDFWKLSQLLPVVYFDFSTTNKDGSRSLYLTDEATEELEKWEWEHKKWSVPLVISIISLLVSMAALFRP